VTEKSPIIDVEKLLAPIAGDRPVGNDLRYDATFDRIRASRKVADDKQQGRSAGGDPEGASTSPEERAAAARNDWTYVADLLCVTLVTETKDLQLAIWLLEAATYLEGFAGAASGFELIRRLLETYWDDIYPAIDLEDDEPLALRTGVMEWIDERLPLIVKSIPLSGGSRRFSLADWELAQKATTETLKTDLANAGRPSTEQFAQALAASNLPHLEALKGTIETCVNALGDLEMVTDTRFVTTGSSGRQTALVSFSEARKVFGECQFQVERAIRTKKPPETTRPIGPGVDGLSPLASHDADEVWDRAHQLVMQGQLEGLHLAQRHIEAATSGRERFLRQLHLSEICIRAGMHAFAYPILDELGKIIDERKLAEWEDVEVIRRTWSGLADVCRPLARLRPESVKREADARRRLSELVDTPPAVAEG
jgi:type VI secretion system protein ImpA